jgi:thiol-disulfide isomerase/thioredoxin
MKPRVVALVVSVIFAGYWFYPRPELAPPAGAKSVVTYDVVVAFTAPWCGECVADKPYLNHLARTKIIVTIDGSNDFKVPLPFYILYHNGVEQFRTHNIQDIR